MTKSTQASDRRIEMIEVGEFRYDPKTDEVFGPAEYMREQGFDRLRRIGSGQDTVFNYGVSTGASPSPQVAALVSLQTDYAGWKGLKDFNTMRGAS